MRMRNLNIYPEGYPLMLAPLVHKAHMVWMLVPYALLFACAPRELGPIARRARWTLVALSVFFVAFTAPAILGRATATLALSHSFVGFGVISATCALAIDVWARPTAKPRSTEWTG